MPIDRQICAEGARHLRRVDPTLAEVIGKIGPCTLRVRRDRFASLAQSILSQQVSTQAAATIGRRLAAAAGGRICPEALAGLTDEEIRGAGVSPQKLRYIRDLCDRTADGRIQLSRLGHLSDARVIETLTCVKGIGVWTAQMFLIFVLGRTDILPCGDLGVQNAMQQLYGLAERPSPPEMEAIAALWHPYASIGSWYCWRSLD
ncbi:MAG: DNA-3-methyladenine glycosylase [Candidatus Binatia bacterium]|nr:DNA-3-methyladenine glycosylase [Candidatus Binatia bacterium]MDG2009828.1 DNA-3-methyladenine glycosylase [Candidatus Binatia bacterium]HAC81625.1 DNA-3-methyladenine glycosylase 2 family protein [Deltaproteobacteria bacterium]